MLVSYDTFNSCCTKRQKKSIFRHEFDKNLTKSQFYENMDENLIYVHLCVIWQYHPCDMYIYLHTIGLIGTFPNPEIKALSLTQLNTSGGRRNM